MQLAPVAGHIGAEVLGIDLTQDISEATATFLRQALDDHLVLFLRDQSLDLPTLKRATTVFGPLLRVPYVKPSPEDADVIAVLKEADEVRIGVFGGDWHSDFSFLEAPPGGSLLYGEDIPTYGGDTLWSNQILAYETLPDDLRSIVDGRGAIHTGGPYGTQNAPDATVATSRSIGISRGNSDADREVLHPAVRQHPTSGRRALFVNPIYTRRLEGMSESESRPILERLYAHATRPELTCRFRWTPGSLAIWDNRSTMHYAINDYDGQRRLLYRTTFAGERPV
ncbi:TauD/TfdA family dioxygenase [Limibacillus sp. MBR-115]|jgi:taurine dioxygenase|uniref:TauD/TfdA dioxygenase family protein n=1 Tax=Limibacillus sp. MBR-115 TaxID=3156465 RepID=UPI003399C9B3